MERPGRQRGSIDQKRRKQREEEPNLVGSKEGLGAK